HAGEIAGGVQLRGKVLHGQIGADAARLASFEEIVRQEPDGSGDRGGRDPGRGGAFAGAEARLRTRGLSGSGLGCGGGDKGERDTQAEGGHGGASYSSRARRTGVSAGFVACRDRRVRLAAPIAPRTDVQL